MILSESLEEIRPFLTNLARTLTDCSNENLGYFNKKFLEKANLVVTNSIFLGFPQMNKNNLNSTQIISEAADLAVKELSKVRCTNFGSFEKFCIFCSQSPGSFEFLWPLFQTFFFQILIDKTVSFYSESPLFKVTNKDILVNSIEKNLCKQWLALVKKSETDILLGFW